DVATGRQRRAAIEHADVVESQKPALEDVHPFRILPVHPPGEVEQQLVEDALQECAVALAVPLLINLVNPPRGPGMNRGIYVSKCPLVSWELPIRVQIPLA